VHEAYLRLIQVTQVRWQKRAHFFAMSARVMRRVLVDAARARLLSAGAVSVQHHCERLQPKAAQRFKGVLEVGVRDVITSKRGRSAAAVSRWKRPGDERVRPRRQVERLVIHRPFKCTVAGFRFLTMNIGVP